MLASNALARALTPLSEPGTNLLRSWFLDHEDRKRYDDGEYVLTVAVAYFRASVAGDPDDPDVQNLVDELSLQSEEFRKSGLATTSNQGCWAKGRSITTRPWVRSASATGRSRSPVPRDSPYGS